MVIVKTDGSSEMIAGSINGNLLSQIIGEAS
jgi:hypothetical protein